MLLKFRVANHRSLRDEQTLDLRPVYRDDRDTLPVAALYGANASGKSTVLDAIRFMHDVVTEQVTDWRAGGSVPRKPFLLDEESPTAPSSFAVELLLNNVRYAYGFTIDNERVLEEWCFSYPKKQPRVLFDRTIERVKFGTTTQGSKSDLLAELTPPNMLFLATAARSAQSPYLPVYKWFKENLWFVNPEENLGHEMTRTLISESERSVGVLALLQLADLGITSVEVKRPEVNVNVTNKTSESSKTEVQRIVFETGHGDPIEMTFNGSQEEFQRFLDGAQNRRARELRFTHLGKLKREFSFNDESHGTKTWFNLAGFSLEALRNGWTLVVDEIDTSLHPLLVARLIRLFQDPDVNTHNAQLIMSTHDTSLLGRHSGDDLLRRDEVWFVEKDASTGASSLYSLTEFRPRDGLNWEKRYLGGAVGGVPFLDEVGLAAAARSYTANDNDKVQ